MALLTGPTNTLPLSSGWHVAVYKSDDPEGDPVAVYDHREDGWYQGSTKVDDAGQAELDAHINALPPQDPPTVIPIATPLTSPE